MREEKGKNMSNDVCCLCFPNGEIRLKQELSRLIKQYLANRKECFYVVCQVADTKNNRDPRLQLTRDQYNSLNLIGKDVLIEHVGEPCGKVILSWHRHLDYETYGICAILEIKKSAFTDVQKENLRQTCGEVSLATIGQEKKALEVSLVTLGARPGTVVAYADDLIDLICKMHDLFGFAQYGKSYKKDKLEKIRFLSTLKLSNEEIIRASKQQVKMDSENTDLSAAPIMEVPSKEKEVKINSEEEGSENDDNDDDKVTTSETVLEKFGKDIKEMPIEEVFNFMTELCSELYNTKARVKETDQILNPSSDGMSKIFSHVIRGLNKDDKSCKKFINDWHKLKRDSELGTKHFSENSKELARRTSKQLEILGQLSTYIPSYNKTNTKSKLWEYMVKAGVAENIPPQKNQDESIGEKTNGIVKASIKKMNTPQQHQFYSTSDGGETFHRMNITSGMNNTTNSTRNNEYYIGDTRKLFNTPQPQQQLQPMFLPLPSTLQPSQQLPQPQQQPPQPQLPIMTFQQPSLSQQYQSNYPPSSQMVFPYSLQLPQQLPQQPQYTYFFPSNTPIQPIPVYPSPSQPEPEKKNTVFNEAFLNGKIDEIKKLLEDHKTKNESTINKDNDQTTNSSSLKRGYDNVGQSPIPINTSIIKASEKELSQQTPSSSIKKNIQEKYNTWSGQNK